jgi:hypothetical protein
MGALAESTGDKIEANGAPSLSYPVEARKITDYMKEMPKWMAQWPFTVMGVNHKKVYKQPDGTISVTMPGGASLKFHESIEIDMRRVGDQFHRIRQGEQGVRVRIDINKNSTAPKHNELYVEVVWWYDSEHLNSLGQARQITIFDWHSATIETLAGYEGIIGGRVENIVDLHVNRDSRTVWSSALRIPEKKPVSWREGGAALEERPDLLYPLYDVLGIRRRYLFQPGIDFRKQVAFLAAQRDEARVREAAAQPAVTEAFPDDGPGGGQRRSRTEADDGGEVG